MNALNCQPENMAQTHKKWEPGTLYAKAMRDITNEHNATVDAWQAAVAEAERLGRANSDLCDQITASRVPQGWELDVTAEEYAAWKLQQFGCGNSVVAARQSLDWLKPRIKPVYECKECAKWKAYGVKMEDNARVLANRIDAARAALEGES